MNGSVVAISIDTGHIDTDTMSRHCLECINLNPFNIQTDSEQKCTINHGGSEPKLDQSEVERIFGASIIKNKLRTEYYGDVLRK